jgi:hypothetical protein
MKQKITFLSVICLALFLTSCSTLSEFMIVNDSGSEIEVEYKVKDINNYELPRITDSAKISGMSKEWQNLSEDSLKVDKETRTINVKLPGNKAVIVASDVNYSGHDTEDFSIESIKIKSGESAVEYTGKQAQRTFIRQKNEDYVIVYK